MECGAERAALGALSLVWATITALAVGLGPFAGALALALHTAGVLGRLYAEALENAPVAPAQALRRSGSARALAFLYGTLPGAAPQLLAYTLYRWEMNIRMAAILGFVGAGGLGQLLYFRALAVSLCRGQHGHHCHAAAVDGGGPSQCVAAPCDALGMLVVGRVER